MALTNEELTRVTNIESAINDIQTYVTNLASKTVVRQLNTLREQGIAALNTKIDNVSTTGSNELTVDDLGIFATKEQMKQLLLLNQQEMIQMKADADASSYLRTMQDVTIHDPQQEGQILRFDNVNGWENADLNTAGLASAIHSHNLEALSNVSTAGLESGFILQYNSTLNRWEGTEANMAQITDGPAGAFGIYNDATSTIVPLTALNWDIASSALQIQGNLALSGSTEIKGDVIDNIGAVPVTLDIFNISQYRTVKYLVEIKDKDLGKYLSQEILLVHDDQEVYISEYGVIFTSEDNFTTFTAELDINAGTIVLRCQCTGPNNVAKLTRIVMTA
jgi:microcystin-dependent protein